MARMHGSVSVVSIQNAFILGELVIFIMPTRADQCFFACLLPLAIAAFCSGPFVVLRSFGLLDSCFPFDALSTPLRHAVASFSSRLSATHSLSTRSMFPDEVPLLFQQDKYPLNGKKTLFVYDERFLQLTKPTTRYIPITDTQKLHENHQSNPPEGDLLLVRTVKACEDGQMWFDTNETTECSGVRMETEWQRRFRLQRVRRDEATGLLYAHIEWI